VLGKVSSFELAFMVREAQNHSILIEPILPTSLDTTTTQEIQIIVAPTQGLMCEGENY